MGEEQGFRVSLSKNVAWGVGQMSDQYGLPTFDVVRLAIEGYEQELQRGGGRLYDPPVGFLAVVSPFYTVAVDETLHGRIERAATRDNLGVTAYIQTALRTVIYTKYVSYLFDEEQFLGTNTFIDNEDLGD